MLRIQGYWGEKGIVSLPKFTAVFSLGKVNLFGEKFVQIDFRLMVCIAQGLLYNDFS